MPPVVAWFRRDLRLHDHPALTAAIATGEPVACLFVIDDGLIHGRWPGANRVSFMLEALASLRECLRAIGGELCIRRGRPMEVVPGFARDAGARDVFVSRDYSPYARKRDAAVGAALELEGARLHARRGTLVQEPEDVLKDDGSPFAVYSPFRRRWEGAARRPICPEPERLTPVAGLAATAIPTLEELGFERPESDLPAASEAAARERLEAFVRAGLAEYADRRNVLASPGTSHLSADLRWGLLSPLDVVEQCSTAGPAAATFISEVAWREFYYHVLWHQPRVVREPFQRQFDGIQWRDDEESFAAWKDGRTGYPVVDAGMRQLRRTGWMHNRARMITASFLAKHLLLDWRKGEAWFMEQLVDGDVANNDGGWQWTASTGTDPQPYFRIFNPVLQGQKFDPSGDYVRRWVPELTGVPERYIHEPWRMPIDVQREAQCAIGRDYPGPIVDHGVARERALRVYREAQDERPAPPSREVRKGRRG